MIRLPALGAFPSPPPTWTTCRSFIGHSFLTWASCTSLKISDMTCLSARLHQGGAGLILILCLLKCRLPGEVSPEPSFPHTVPASFCPYSCQPLTHYLGEGNGSFSNPLQYSCLENPRDRGAWWAAVCVPAPGPGSLMIPQPPYNAFQVVGEPPELPPTALLCLSLPSSSFLS